MSSAAGSGITSLAQRGTVPFVPIRSEGALEPGAWTEHQAFLLLCDLFASQRDDERQHRVAAAVSQIDGIAALVSVAEQERVVPALHEVVALKYASPVPKGHRALLATRQEANRRRNAAIRQALLELGEAGASAGIRFVALKGAAWIIEDAAGCAAWRQMVDIDVLVDPRQFDAVPPLLERLGYAVASRSQRFKDNYHHPPYRHPEIPVTLEVHRHTGWRHRLLAPETLFPDASSVAPGLLLASPWTRAFHAIIHWQIQDHGASRGTVPLKELIEVARFLTRSDVDWALLSAHAGRVGVVEACEMAIASAASLLNAPVPREIVPRAAAQRWIARSLARRSSVLKTWLATQVWRAGSLWWCEKFAYRLALRGAGPFTIVLAVWAARIVRLPVLAVRAAGIALGAIVRLAGFARASSVRRPRQAQQDLPSR
jgi:hypothetical protein